MLALIPFVLSNWRVFLYGGTAIAIGLLALHERSVLINQGAQQAIEKVEKSNEQAKSAADAAQAKVDACYAAGGTWDRVNSVCLNPTR